MFQKKIKNGIQYLNQNYPNWLHKISVDKLIMNSGCRCIMGQLLGHFHTGTLDIGLDKMEELGFYLSGDNAHHYMELTQEWKEEIKKHHEKA